MATTNFTQMLSSLLLLCTVAVNASDICVYEDRYKVCDHGCCSNDCCMSPFQIAGIVFGALAFICLIAAVVLYCVKRQKRKERVVSDVQPRMVMVNGYNHPVGFNTTQPFAPGYASSYGHPGVPPPYSATTTHMPPPQYHGYPGGPFPPQPPPAYNYNHEKAVQNPFYIAALDSSLENQGPGHSRGNANPGSM